LCGKLGCQFDRSNHARVFSKSFACDVEGSAMID